MGLYNRWLRENEPADWTANHQQPDRNRDWYRWHIAVHPFTDLIFLYIRGELGTGAAALDKARELFDLSTVERQQFVELYTNFIDGATEAERILNLMQFQSIMRAVERGIPQRYVPDLKVWLYDKFGITIADDR